RASAVASLEDPTPSLESAELALSLCAELEREDGDVYPAVFGTERTVHLATQAKSSALLAGAYLGAWQRVASIEPGPEPSAEFELPQPILARVRGHRACYFALAGRLADAEHEAAGIVDGLRHERSRVEHVGIAAQVAMADVHRGRGRGERALSAYRDGTDRAQAGRRHNLLAHAVSGQALVQLDLGRADDALRVLTDHGRKAVHRAPATLRGRLAAAELLARHRSGDKGREPSLLEAGEVGGAEYM